MRSWRYSGVVVVDGGPRSCGFELKRKLNELGTPDLMVLTHYDEDHIGGILQLVDTCLDDNMIPAKEVWANYAGYVEVAASKYTTAAHGMLLSVRLNELASNMEWSGVMICMRGWSLIGLCQHRGGITYRGCHEDGHRETER